MNPQNSGNKYWRLAVLITVLGVMLALGGASSAWALNADSVIIYDERIPAGVSSIFLYARLVNSERLSEISVPLEFRQITPGAFIFSIDEMSFTERLFDPNLLPDNIRTDQFESRNGVSCHYGNPDFIDGAFHPVASSPEGIWIYKSGDVDAEYLMPGVDGIGSLRIGVSTTLTPGMFEIDTMCMDPGTPTQHLRFVSPDVPGEMPVVFEKGIIRLNGPPVARDTTITVFVNSIAGGSLFMTDPNTEDTVLFSTITPPALGGWALGPDGAFVFSAPATPGTLTADFAVDDGLLTDNATVTIIVEPLPPDTIYVRKNGSNTTGDGSSDNPFRTIPLALSVANTGDLIFVGPGIYEAADEVPIVFPPARSLSIVSEEGPFVTELVGTSGATGSVVVMEQSNPANVLTISGFTIRDNSINDPGCDFCGGGITVAPSTVARILNCVIRHNSASGAPGKSGGGIQFAGAGGIIANNWIVDNNFGVSDPAAVGAIIVSAGADVAIVNNTISNNHSAFVSGIAGVQIENSSAISRFDNNLVSFNTPGRGLLSVSDLPGGEPTFNNLYFGNGSAPQGFPSALTWVLTDPLMVGPAAGDYHLTCASPARDNGEFTSVPVDIDADIDLQPRVLSNPSRVDIGADQFYDEDKQASFLMTADSGCVEFAVGFGNTSSCIDEQWLWTFGDGDSSTAKNPVHQYNTPGTYSIRLIAFGDYDADTTFDTVRVHADLDATILSSAQSGCVPLQVGFTGFADGSVDIFAWDFGDGDVDTGQHVVHTYTTPATRSVTLYVTNMCGTYEHTEVDYIVAGTLPSVQITSSIDNVVGAPCNPYQVQFGYTSDVPIHAWNWDFGDNSTSTDSTPVHTYALGDTFSVRLIAAGECGNVQVVRSNYIRLTPRPIVTADVTPSFACVGTTQVDFAASVTGSFSSATWLFGDGATGNGLHTTHSYSQVGRYMPKLIVVSTCGQDTVSIGDSITVGSLSNAAFSVSADTGYEPFTIQFSDESSNLPTSWLWRFGDNSTSTQQHPTHAYTGGTYQASLIVGNSCGADTSGTQQILVGSFQPVIADSLGTSGDTILYSVRVDTLVIGYDHTVYLAARFTPFPLQGTMSFALEPPSGVPPFTSILKVVPSLNLESGNYIIEVRAVDSSRLSLQGTPVTKIATRAYTHVGFASLEVTPPQLSMDSTIVSLLTSRTLTIRNISTVQNPYTLIVQPAQTSGPPFEILPNQGAGATLLPGQAVVWTLGFRPTRKGDVSGWVRIRSNDPGDPDFQVTLTGRGLGEQVPPTVTAVSPTQNSEALIDQVVTMTFSEGISPLALDTILSVRSQRANSIVPGVAQLTPLSLTFTPTEWFWPDDTISVTLRAIVGDTNGNRLDGNADGSEDGSPVDDYHLTFMTGPGVFPGDANHDGAVNEGDILPIGRFWNLQGPPRSRPFTSFTVQPARGFPTRVAAHADCDGNGVINADDICPIAQFFDRDTVLPKATVETWLTEAQSWSSTVIDQLIASLEACPTQTQGTVILHQVLSSMQTPTPVPAEYDLGQNYPNPFNPATVISFSIAQPGDVTLVVYDILGRQVAVLASEVRDAGNHHVVWDGRDDEGRAVASGIYFYRLQSGEFTQTRKMLLLK